MSEQSLCEVAAQLWVAEDDLFFGGRAAHLPLRMTVIRLADGGLVLWSPIALSDPLVAALAQLGPVQHIVAPNSFHHLHAQAAADRYPDAALWLSPGLERKVPRLTQRGRIMSETPPAWGDDLTTLHIAGMPSLEEIVAFHGPSGTLIVTDLVFNMQTTRGFLTPLMMRLAGAHRRFAQSHLLRRLVKDRSATRESYTTLLGWNFDRIIMAHGEIVASGGRSQLAEELAWIDPQLAHARA